MLVMLVMLVMLGSLVVLTSLACSSLAPVETPQGCTVDADCQTDGHVCGEGVCYDPNLPPRSHIGLDVRGAGLATNFRFELRGEDSAVLRIDRSPIRFSVSLDDRKGTPGVRDRLEISLRETFVSSDKQVSVALAGDLTFSQASRLGRDPVIVTNRHIALVDMMGNPVDEADARLTLPWARYDRDPLGNDIPLLLGVIAEPGVDEISGVDVHRGPVYRQLVRPQLAGVGLHAFTIHTRRECHRKIRGAVVIGADGTPVSGVNLEFRHARHDPGEGDFCDPEPEAGTPALCSLQTIVPNGGLPECITINDCPAPYGCHATGDDAGSKRCGCTSDGQCPSGQVCEIDRMRCALDLGGLLAARDETIDDTNAYDAWVYTYCDDDLGSDREIDFVVTATPRGEDAVVPALSFRTQIDFLWGNGVFLPADPKQVCLPDWAPPQAVLFALASPPQPLHLDADGEPWTCCSSACLDSEEEEPPTPPATCPLGATVTASTLFTPDPAPWKKFSCMELDRPDLTVPEGSQRVVYGPFDTTSCATDGTPCTLALSSGTKGLEYSVRIEPPVGSLVRSMILPPQVVDAGTPSIVAPPLAYRVLLRGRVELAPLLAMDGSVDLTVRCPVNAEIMAERLRVPGEDPSTILGPYFYSAHTIPGSLVCDPGSSFASFVLPVNPGVYLVTALPQTGSQGGPAKIVVLDLREGSPLVDSAGPMPVADLPAPLVMEPGTLVTIELDNFDRSSVATPLDLAGWMPIDGYPDLDLNRPDTCHGATDRGCEIRRLRPKGGLSPTQEQYVKYLTRRPASQ